MQRSLLLWQRLRASFWFVPTVVVVCSMAAAVGLVEFDGTSGADLAAWAPRLFGAGVEGSRAMLSAIATSMVTVAGVVFSITIVALSLTSTQYSPRVLRNFMRDRPTQLVLGVFLGIFVYCLVVLRTLRGSGEPLFVPSLAVLGGMVYALAGVRLLIFFIHHVSQGIQAASIIRRISADTAAAIDHLYPQDERELTAATEPVAEPAGNWVPVLAKKSGYVTSVDAKGLVAIARESDRVFRLAHCVGDFVAEGSILLEASGHGAIAQALEGRLLGTVLLQSQRTVEQDAAFGLQQLVDVALKALSPSVNDPTTACMAIDRIGALLGRLAGKQMPEPHRLQGGRLYAILPAPGFADILLSVLLPILEHGRADSQVLWRLVAVISTLSERTRVADRRGALRVFTGELRREVRRLRSTRSRIDLSHALLPLESKLHDGGNETESA